MEKPIAPAEVREQPVIRTSAGAGAVLGADGQLLAVAAGATVDASDALESGEEPA